MSKEELRSAAAAEVDRWERQLGDELTRLFDRQQAVVLARLQGTKARKHTRHWSPAGERKMDPRYVVDAARWAQDAVASVGPVIRRMYDSVWSRVTKVLGGSGAMDEDSLEFAVQDRLAGISQGVETAVGEVQAFIDREEEAGSAMPDIVSGVRDLYTQRTGSWVSRITTLSAVGTINHAAMSAAFNAGSVQKQWLSRRDERVRDTHEHADGQVRPILGKFKLGGIPTHPRKSELLFPGDPSPEVPLDEVINCRCTLLFSPPRGDGAGRGLAGAAALGLIVAAGAAAAAAGEGGGGTGAATGVAAAGAAYAASQQAPPPAEAQEKALPKAQKCKYCSSQATKRIIHSEGMAYIPVCGGHIEKGKTDAAACVPYGSPDPSNIDAIRDIKTSPLLELKDKVRSLAGVRQYGQPIGSTIHRDPLLPTFTAPKAGSSPAPASSGRTARVKIGNHTVEVGGPGAKDAYALAAKYDPSGVGPDPATSQVIALRDHKGRVGAYVIWATADGAKPKGTVLAVSVHPKLAGQRIGDQLVGLAAKMDPDVIVTTRPRNTTPATPSSRSVANTPNRATTLPAAGPPTVRSRAQAGDQPGTSGDFNADAARIERLQRAYMRDGQDTERLFSRGGRWSKAREKQQQEIIDHFLSQPGVKKDHQILILGGLPGAGKTSTINSAAGQAALGVDLSEYVTVNADEVKAEMVARGMVPDYPGLSPDEAATLYHAESFEIAHSLMRQAARRNMNFAYDTSLKSTGQVGFATSAGSRTAPPPWRTTMLFVDVPLAVAKQRARDRYLAGGRYMPLGLIDGMRARNRSASSAPSENFDLVKRQADKWVVVDNAGAAPVVVGTGGGRKSPRSARIPLTPPPAKRAPSSVPPSVPSPAPAPTPAAAISAPKMSAPVSPSSVPSLPPGLPPVPAGATVYAHPQGKHIYVLPDGSMETYKPDGKRATSSATPAKLAAGYGGWTVVQNPTTAPAAASGSGPALVPDPKKPVVEQPSAPAPVHARPVVPMDFNEAQLADVPKYIADDDYVFQQKVDGIRGILVVEPGKAPWFASKKGDKLVSSTAAKVTGPLLAKMPATPAGSPGYRVEGELVDGKWHVFDMITDGGEQLPYEKRKAMADAWVDAVSPALPQVQALPTATTPAAKQALWDAVLNSGAEGVMMKRRDAGYQGGQRVNHTLKAKVTATADVVITGRNVGGKDNATFGLRRGGKVVEIGTVSTGGKDKALGQINVGDVVEVEYLWASAGDKLTQPRILRKRPDKTPNDATDVSQLRLVDKTVLALAKKRHLLRLEGTDAVRA